MRDDEYQKQQEEQQQWEEHEKLLAESRKLAKEIKDNARRSDKETTEAA